MRAAYEDIRRRIADPPRWWAENGVPRYDPFRPQDCSCLTAHQVVLLRIACAACRQEFDVEIYRQQTNRFEEGKHRGDWLLPFDAVSEIRLDYGDPPRHGEEPGEFRGCLGESMNSNPLRVLEAWFRDRDRKHKEWIVWTEAGEIGEFDYDDWYRSPELEGVYV